MCESLQWCFVVTFVLLHLLFTLSNSFLNTTLLRFRSRHCQSIWTELRLMSRMRSNRKSYDCIEALVKVCESWKWKLYKTYLPHPKEHLLLCCILVWRKPLRSQKRNCVHTKTNRFHGKIHYTKGKTSIQSKLSKLYLWHTGAVVLDVISITPFLNPVLHNHTRFIFADQWIVIVSMSWFWTSHSHPDLPRNFIVNLSICAYGIIRINLY